MLVIICNSASIKVSLCHVRLHLLLETYQQNCCCSLPGIHCSGLYSSYEAIATAATTNVVIAVLISAIAMPSSVMSLSSAYRVLLGEALGTYCCLMIYCSHHCLRIIGALISKKRLEVKATKGTMVNYVSAIGGAIASDQGG